MSTITKPPVLDETGIAIKKTLDHMAESLQIIAYNDISPSINDSIVTASCTGENTTRLFWTWYAGAQTGSDDRYELLCRFFSALARGWADKTYTLRYYVASVSGDPTMTPLDDLAGKTAAPVCTDASENTFHWTDEDPMYWYIRANALSKADGTMNILAFEGEDAFDITGTTAPVYTFKMAKWKKEWESGSYRYISWRATQEAGYRPYAADVNLDGTKRAITWTPTFPGGLNPSGGLTSGAGIKPYIWKSANDGIVDARKTTASEGLWSDQDTLAVLHDWQFRHFNLENSGILEGCTSYYYDYTPAVAESDVNRVIVTTAQGNTLVVGSTVCLTASARASSGAAVLKKITAIESVEINNTTYAAVYLDMGEDTFTTTTDMHLCTMPWYSGSTEAVPGHKDGCIGNLTNGKYPIRVGGVEMMHGAYDIGLDPLYNVTASDTAEYYNYAIYECKDSENLAGSITDNYEDTGLSYTKMHQGWNYVKAFKMNDKGIVFPESVGGDSTHYLKSAFDGAYSAGVRCPWRYGYLDVGGVAGLACEHGGITPANSSWNSRPRLSGSGKKRGEWAA